MRQPALLLDRDGVINVDHGYVHHCDRFEFIDGIFELCRAAAANGYRLIVVTNQAGIGRGYYSEHQFHRLTAWMCDRFLKEGAPIDKVYFSPFHPTKGVGKYKKDDISRKPRPGRILLAQRDFDLDLANSILIGDKATDIEAGVAASVGTNILFSKRPSKGLTSQPSEIIGNLSEALSFITRQY